MSKSQSTGSFQSGVLKFPEDDKKVTSVSLNGMEEMYSFEYRVLYLINYVCLSIFLYSINNFIIAIIIT